MTGPLRCGSHVGRAMVLLSAGYVDHCYLPYYCILIRVHTYKYDAYITYIICLYICLYVSQDLFGLKATGDDLPARGKVLPIGKGRIVKEHTVMLHIPYTTILHVSF